MSRTAPSKAAGRGRRGFALPELVVLVLVVFLILVLSAAAGRRARLAGWDAADAENLHRYAAATTCYAADNNDLFWATSWRKGMDLPTDYPDLKGKNDSESNAATAQIIDILRRKGGRSDIQFITNWIPQIYYSHLPLFDYLDQELPALWAVSPADRNRLDWARDHKGFDQGAFLPCEPTGWNTNAGRRWPYSSSYQLAPCFWDQSDVDSRMSQANGFDSYAVPANFKCYAHHLAEAAFPSQKVHIFGMREYHLGEGHGADCDTPREFCYPDARVALLFVDGHTAWHKTADANPGWRPNYPQDPGPSYITVGGKSYPGVYRWTRQGVGGRDFGGPEPGLP